MRHVKENVPSVTLLLEPQIITDCIYHKFFFVLFKIKLMLSIECKVDLNNTGISSYKYLIIPLKFACSFQNIIMATFFGEVMTGSYRYIDPNQPDYNESRCLPQTWNLENDIDKENNLLLITVGDIAGDLIG